MNKLKELIDSFQRSATSIQVEISDIVADLEIRENNIEREKKSLSLQRGDLIEKQNAILSQVQSMKADREGAEKKMREAQALKKITDEEKEQLDIKYQQLKDRETEVELKEKKVLTLLRREEDVKRKELIQQEEKEEIERERLKIDREKMLLDEKKTGT